MESLSTNDPRTVFIATLPNPKDLCCVEVSITKTEKHDSSAKSNFHWRILKCRQLIFSEQQILASPVFGSETLIYIVMMWKFYENEKIKMLFKSMNLLAKEPFAVSNGIYESCLRYTILARIAPLWNQVEKYLVYGRDFLTSTAPLKAVKLDICVNDSQVLLILWPLRIKLEHIKLKDLDISLKVSQEFTSQAISTISELQIGSQWIHVLPSAKKGQVVNISHQIPKTCPYKSYKELKRHWKNMYGYRLPEEDKNMLYYTVSFHPMNFTLYTYPEVCVKSSTIMILRHVNQLEILKSFHDDLMKKTPTVCGQPFGINKNLAYAIPKLYSSTESDESLGNRFNLNLSDLVNMEPVIIPPTLLDHADLENKSLSVDTTVCTSSNQTLQPLGVCNRNVDYVAPTPPLSMALSLDKEYNQDSRASSQLNKSSLPFPYYPLPFKNTTAPADVSLGHCQSKYVPIFKRKLCYSENVLCKPSPAVIPANSPYLAQKSQNSSIVVNNNNVDRRTQDLKTPHNSSVEQVNTISHSQHIFKGLQPPGTPLHIKIVPNSELQNIPVVHEINLKRDAQYLGHNDMNSAVKKPRSRPQIQFDVDVEVLARNNDLARVNTATLVNWLRNKLVPCKVKDKKSELVDKVMNYLKLSH